MTDIYDKMARVIEDRCMDSTWDGETTHHFLDTDATAAYLRAEMTKALDPRIKELVDKQVKIQQAVDEASFQLCTLNGDVIEVETGLRELVDGLNKEVLQGGG